MFHPMQIKHECIDVEEPNLYDGNNTSAFISENANYKHNHIPQFWYHAQLSNGIRPKAEIDIQQNLYQTGETDTSMYTKDYVQNSTLFQVNPEQNLNLNYTDQQYYLSTVQKMEQSCPPQDAQQLRLENQMLTISEPISSMKSTHPGNSLADSSESKVKKKYQCQCKICFKQFGHKSNLFIHMRTHNGERPYKCKQCKKCFTHSGNLAVHMRTHSGEKPYGCQVCGKTFSHSGNLSTHLRTHSGVRPYKCNTCGKEFRHSGNLSTHKRIHSGIKPYQCKLCGRDFCHSGNLTTHMKRHTLNINISVDRHSDNEQQAVNFNETVPLNSFSNLSSPSIDAKILPNTNNIVPIKCENDQVLTNTVKM